MENILERINTSAIKFLVPLTTDETFKIIVSESHKVIGGEYGSIFLEEGSELRRVYADVDFLYAYSQKKRGAVYSTFNTRKPRLISVENGGNIHPELKKRGITSVILIPLFYKERSIGVLSIHFKGKHDFSEKDLHILTLYGSLASMAIRKTQLYDETKSALETRDLFISLASHELRTPLTSINGYIQLLHSKLAKSKTIEGRWIQELFDESKRLTNLIKELLEINRIKQGQLHYNLRETYIHTVITAAIKRYSFITPERVIRFEDKVADDLIIGDEDKLMQVVTALLSNADKFSPPTTPILVTTKGTKFHILIQIKDQGAGIPGENMQKVFDGFYKGTYKQSEGLGVGLLLAKHIIQYHHGAIGMKSKIGKGTTVEVRLPRIKPSSDK